MRTILAILFAASAVHGAMSLRDPFYVSSLSTGATAAPPAFTYYATHFDGSVYMTNGATGISDSQRGLCSFWFNREVGENSKTMIMIGSCAFKFVNPELGVNANTNGGTKVLDYYNTVSPSNTNWHHAIYSFDMSTAGRRQLYIDGTNAISQVTFTVGSIIDYDSAACVIGWRNDGSSTPFHGSLCEPYFIVPASWVDLSQSGTIEKFRNVGKPVDLGADGSTPGYGVPLIYLHNAYTGFQTNQGSGGNFTIYGGSLSAAATTP